MRNKGTKRRPSERFLRAEKEIPEKTPVQMEPVARSGRDDAKSTAESWYKQQASRQKE